jgi:hypothetical protein
MIWHETDRFTCLIAANLKCSSLATSMTYADFARGHVTPVMTKQVLYICIFKKMVVKRSGWG